MTIKCFCFYILLLSYPTFYRFCLQLVLIFIIAGIIHYKVSYASAYSFEKLSPRVKVIDKDGELVQQSEIGSVSGTLNIPKANFWWPYLMDPDPGYLYTLEVQIRGKTIFLTASLFVSNCFGKINAVILSSISEGLNCLSYTSTVCASCLNHIFV